jgi:hypothetical protein
LLETQQSNIGNSGNGIVTVTQIMYIGSTTSANCVAVGPPITVPMRTASSLRSRFNLAMGTLANASTVTVGQCPAAILNTARESCASPNYITDARAALAGRGADQYESLWQSSSAVTGGTATALTDGQAVYIVETYFQSPDLSVGSLGGQRRLRAVFLLGGQAGAKSENTEIVKRVPPCF